MSAPQQAGGRQVARAYSFRNNGRSNRGLSGDHIFRKGAGVEVFRPSWKGTTTTIRIYPALCLENSALFDPWRFSGENDDFGDWIRTYPVVRNFGDPGLTFVLFDPANQTYDVQTNPCWLLFHAVDRAIADGVANPSWVPMTRGSTGRAAALKRPGDMSMVQGAIFQHNNKEFLPPKGGTPSDAPHVIELPPSAATAMLYEMGQKVPEFRGDPTDFNGMYVNGDPVGLHAGRFVNFFQEGFDPRQAMHRGNPQATFGQERARQGGGGGRGRADEPIGYGCFLSPDYRGISPVLTDHEALVRAKWRPWDTIIQILSNEDQVQLLSGAFPPDMILYALESHYRNAIPQAVHDRYRNHSTVGQAGYNPGGQPGYGYNPQAGGWGGQPAAQGFGGQPAPQGQYGQPPQQGFGGAPQYGQPQQGFGGQPQQGHSGMFASEDQAALGAGPQSGQTAGWGGQTQQPVQGHTPQPANPPQGAAPQAGAAPSGWGGQPAPQGAPQGAAGWGGPSPAQSAPQGAQSAPQGAQYDAPQGAPQGASQGAPSGWGGQPAGGVPANGGGRGFGGQPMPAEATPTGGLPAGAGFDPNPAAGQPPAGQVPAGAAANQLDQIRQSRERIQARQRASQQPR